MLTLKSWSRRLMMPSLTARTTRDQVPRRELARHHHANGQCDS